MIQAEAQSQSSLLSEAERRKLLLEWNATKLEFPKASSIHEVLEQKLREFPSQIALICRNKQLTCAELDAAAERVAARLREFGVGPETLVGICVERSLEMVIGLLGILKSGGAYVPLDPTYPKERLAFMLEDAKPLVVLTQSTLLDQIPNTAANILCIDTVLESDQADQSDHPSRNTQLVAPKLRAKADHASRITHHVSPLAYVIYTSGSTGKPKGVMVEHKNVLNFFAAMDACIPRGSVATPGERPSSGAASRELQRTEENFSAQRSANIAAPENGRSPLMNHAVTGPNNTWLAVTSPSFDISVLEIFWTLARGFKVVIYPGDDVGKSENSEDLSIGTLIERHAVTHLQCTPSMANMLLLDERTRNALGRLQTLLIGGEPFPSRLARDIRRIFKGNLLNIYGPTETTVWSTTWQFPPETVPTRIPVGRPIANTQIYIVDSNLQPVPPGVEGELLIGGSGVARGYFGREQLTAERFLQNSFLADADDTQHPVRLYRTGDIARYLPDGTIELLGRVDHQVKIRGHRVELGEIEAVLSDHPAVRDVIVLFKELANGEKNLVAYVIPQAGQKLTREELRQFAQEKLPEHMLPARVVFMTEFPQTPNRKIARNAFPEPSDNPEEIHDSNQPATEIEQALGDVWKELLSLQRVGRNDNFFELGGHSMLAMQLVSRVRKRFKVDFPLKNIFERQTLRGMAEIIEAMSWANFAKAPRAGQREVIDV
jgi:non-ribosomal peptide synthetase component F/acyl carrier protein